MIIPDSRTVERVRKQYPAGCRIVLDHMDDPYQKISIGAQATVRGVDDTATVMPSWDEGGSLGIVFGEDSCHKIRTEDEAKVTLDWYGKHQPEENSRCPRCGEVMPGPKSRHAISRWADITVCDQCGTVEALEKAGLTETLPMMEWFCIRQAQNGGGEWKG